jgi:glycosyltransferase involved in cell wall biosynthesis
MLGGKEELSEIYLDSRVAIVPLLKGAGRKGKVGEALSYGIPIVSTSIGAVGFSDIASSGLFVADTPEDMAKAIYDLHENFSLWNSASKLGQDYCRKYLSSKAMRNGISQLLSLELHGDE